MTQFSAGTENWIMIIELALISFNKQHAGAHPKLARVASIWHHKQLQKSYQVMPLLN